MSNHIKCDRCGLWERPALDFEESVQALSPPLKSGYLCRSCWEDFKKFLEEQQS